MGSSAVSNVGWNLRVTVDAAGAALLVGGIGGLVWLDAIHGTLRASVTPSSIAWFLVACAGFVVLLRVQGPRRGMDWRWLLAIGFVLRLALVFTDPTLSDDVYRYLWEGHQVTEGVSPYAYPIDSQLGDPINIPARQLANNPSLASPYLPVAHAIFGLAAFTLPSTPTSMQLIMIAFEALGCLMILRLLRAAGLPDRRVLIYWLNPLVIVEIAHGAHLDALIIGLGAAGLWLSLDRARTSNAAAYAGPVVLAAATLTRPLALLFVPVLFWVWKWPQRVLYGVAVALPIAVTGAWVGLGLSGNEGTGVFGSVRAYSETFRFNSGIYHWSERWIASQSFRGRGWEESIELTRLVVFAAAAVAMLVIMALAKNVDDVRGRLRLLSAPMMIYVVLAPVLHPWYMLLLLMLLPFLAPGADGGAMADGESDGDGIGVGESKLGWIRMAPWLALSCLSIFSYLTYEDPNLFAEREWVRRLEWLPTLGLLGIVLATRVGVTGSHRTSRNKSATAASATPPATDRG